MECKVTAQGDFVADLSSRSRDAQFKATKRLLKAMRQALKYGDEMKPVLQRTISVHQSPVEVYAVADFGGYRSDQSGDLGHMEPLVWVSDEHRHAANDVLERVMDSAEPEENTQVEDAMKPAAQFTSACFRAARAAWPNHDDENHLRDAAVNAFYAHKHLLEALYAPGSVFFEASSETKLVSGRFDFLLWVRFPDP